MLAGVMAERVVGDPSELRTDVGPIIDKEAQQALLAHIEEMRRSARLIAETPLPVSARHGTFVAPAAFEIGSIAELDREHFGPILHAVRYQAGDLDRVIDKINDTGYGLTFGVHSRNQLVTAGRGLVLVTGDANCNATALSGELFAALIAGNVVLIVGGEGGLRMARPVVAELRIAGCPPAVLQLSETAISTKGFGTLPELAAVAICCDVRNLRVLHECLAARDGPLVQLITETDPLQLPNIGHPDYLLRFISERTLTDNTAAVGGNALP